MTSSSSAASTTASAAGDPSTPVAHVVVGLPVPRVFSYAIPPELGGRLQSGQRVRVPFRGGVRLGVVVGLGEEAGAGLEPVGELLDPVPALTAPRACY